MLKQAKGHSVILHDNELLRRRNDNRSYLLELKNENLLLPYRMEAVLYKVHGSEEDKTDIHGGWESPLCELRGHFLGHWLSAAAMHYEATGDTYVKGKADDIVGALAQCQQANGGRWAASIPEKYLYRIAENKPVWAPQYTIHKTFMGLLDMYELTGNKQALDVAVQFGKWFYDWSGQYTEDKFQEILDVETGGMLEIWAALYKITKNEQFRQLMNRYCRKSLFEGLLNDEDVLVNMHANTTIPEILGAAACYEATGEEYYLNVVKAYWKCAVEDRGSYATGGQTCGEIWSPKQKLAARLGDKNQEHCTVYNMMRLADFMFRQTGDSKYMDYWEKGLYNGILAQGYWKHKMPKANSTGSPNEGLLTYYLPLHAGGKKLWSSKTKDFFCCHGTLVQANASHNKGIYYEGEKQLYICQYFDSDYCGEIEGQELKVIQRINPLNGTEHLSSTSAGKHKINPVCREWPSKPERLVSDFKIQCNGEKEFEIMIRIPQWAKGEVVLNVNGEQVSETVRNGFAVLKRKWKNEIIHIEFARKVYTEKLPGSDDMVAFMSGPMVLAGLCGEERTLYVENEERAEEILAADTEREWGNWNNTYKTIHQDINIRFVPLYEIGYEEYTVYFPIKKR